MPEHTPGPWIYRRPTMAQPSAWIYGQDERPVCELNDNRNEYEANARLIAAAPDLLAALKELLTMRNMHLPSSDAEVRAFAAVRDAEGRK